MRIAQSLKIPGKFLLLALTGVVGFCFGVGFYKSFPASLATVPVGVVGIICAIKSTKRWLRAFFSIPALVSGALWIGHWVDPMTGYRIYEWSACPFTGPFTSHLVSRQRDPSSGDVLYGRRLACVAFPCRLPFSAKRPATGVALAKAKIVAS